MLFGTFENPKENFAPQGFSENKENRFVDMLLFKDVHETPAGMKMPEIMKEESLVKRG
ncbi:hypothetical protein D3C78_1884740 [compost metagenome]